MAKVSVSETFDCKPEDLYNILTDYEKYPQFLEEVQGCKIVSHDSTRPVVEYEISIIKSFRYQLKMDQVKPSKVAWTFVDGDLFKLNNGSWELQDLGNGKTKAIYSIEVKFNMFVPGLIEKKLVEVNIPKMMDSYKKRIREVIK